MRNSVLAPFVLIGTLTIGSAAHAGCCDDAWSCIAAVATAGVSCQVQGIIDTVKALNDTVNALFNDLKTRTADIIADARHVVEQSASDVRAIREKALSDLKEAANLSQGLANPRQVNAAAVARVVKLNQNTATSTATRDAPKASPSAAVNSTTMARLPANTAVMAPALADPAAVSNALTRADAYIRDLEAKATQVSREGTDSEAQALSAAARHAISASKIALDVALEPLKNLGDSLLDLLSHPERMFDPSAQIEADLRRIGEQVPAMLDRIGNEVTQEATSYLEKARKPAEQLQDQAEVARNVVRAMQRLVDSKTQRDLEALNGQLPSKTIQVVKLAHGVTLPVGVAGRHELLASAVGRLQVSKLPLVAKHRATVSTILSQWTQVKSQAKTQVRIDPRMVQKADLNLRQLLGNGSNSDLEMRRQRLLQQARQRFAKDPKTLRKVEEYIQSHARG